MINNHYYEHLMEYARKMYKKRGLTTFYNGFTLSCIYQVIYRALYFGIYDSLRFSLVPKQNYDFLVCFPSGYIAAFMSSTLCLPMHRIALRIAMEE